MNTTATAERMPNPVIVFRQELGGMEEQFKAALPAHIPVERFMRVLMTAVQNNPDLLGVERRSLWNAAMKAAQDGLLPDGREGAIVVFKDRNRGPIAQWMPMIAGLRKKVRNSGEIATWDAHVVHENDLFEFELGDNPCIRHQPALDNPGKLIAAYSIATLKSGEKSREVMSIAAIEKVRSRSRAKDNGPWVTDYEEMCRKTVARRHSKVLPMSTDLDDLLRRDDDLYDFDGAREEAKASEAARPRTLAGRLDRLAVAASAQQAGTQIEADTGEQNQQSPEEESNESAETDVSAESAPENGSAGEVTSPEAHNRPRGHSAPGSPAGQLGPANQPNAAAPISEERPLDPLASARKRGADAYRAGHSRKAVPGEYRTADRQEEADAWWVGFDAARAEDDQRGQ